MHAALSGLAFVVRRFGQALLVMLAILNIAFAVRTNLGDPGVSGGAGGSESERAELRKELGFDAPWPVQPGRRSAGAAHGDSRDVVYLQEADGRGGPGRLPAS